MVAERKVIMKVKILVTVAAGMMLMACETAVAAEDKVFTSSGQIVDGEEWNNVSIYNDDTIVDMLGGLVDRMQTYDASTINVTAGDVSTLEAHEFSTANVSGGYVYTLWARDSGTVNLSDSGSVSAVSARGSFSLANMYGGSAHWVDALNSGSINLYGGIVSDYISAPDGTIDIFGYDLSKASIGGRYGFGVVTGYWSDGSSFNIDLLSPETYSHINLFEAVYIELNIRPHTLNLHAKGKFVTCRIQLPKEYNVNDINPDTILIERRFKAEWKWYNEKQNIIMARFKRSQLSSILEPGDVDLIVNCHLIDGTYFEGTDTIKVIDKSQRSR